MVRMTVCTLGFAVPKLVIGVLISIVIPVAVHFVLAKIIFKNSKKKWLSIMVAVALFIILAYLTIKFGMYTQCTGPLIGPDGKILA